MSSKIAGGELFFRLFNESDPLFGNEKADGQIESSVRKTSFYKIGIDQSGGIKGTIFQIAVVVPFAVPQAVSFFIKRKARDDHECAAAVGVGIKQ